jgi:hypothetical protein
MYAASSIDRPSTRAAAQVAGLNCPLNHGVAALDQLLASLMGEDNSEAFDAALDLRSLLSNATDATAIIREFYRLRSLVEERNYLACYRLRRWLEGQLIAWVSPQRHQAERSTAVRLDAMCIDHLNDRCIAAALEGTSTVSHARVRYAFASSIFVA